MSNFLNSGRKDILGEDAMMKVLFCGKVDRASVAKDNAFSHLEGNNSKQLFLGEAPVSSISLACTSPCATVPRSIACRRFRCSHLARWYSE